MRIIQDILHSIPSAPATATASPSPSYFGSNCNGLALAVPSMRRHVSDEGWQLMLGLQTAGYQLAGRSFCDINLTDVPAILKVTSAPGVVVVQDKREWTSHHRDYRDRNDHFTNVHALASRLDLFKVAVVKDLHQRPSFYACHANEIRAHAWVIYYHPRLIQCLAPYIRPEHVIRTYHSIDCGQVPQYAAQRQGCLLSGYNHRGYYPLRHRLIRAVKQLPQTDYLQHPGYRLFPEANTKSYLQVLSRYKAAICTSSIYGYAVRKIIEATACGCRVVTDLPTDDVLPAIDDNLVRVDPDVSTNAIADMLKQLYAGYDPARQEWFAHQAISFYDYRTIGIQLAHNIETARRNYGRYPDLRCNHTDIEAARGSGAAFNGNPGDSRHQCEPDPNLSAVIGSREPE